MTEHQLFNFLEEKFAGLERAEDPFSTWDCTFSVETPLTTVNYYAELKCRDAHYPDLLIEEDKYRRLMQAAAATGRRPVYICSTPEGIWGWDLIKVRMPSWEARLMPATTEFEDTEKVLKVVGFLPVAQGRRLM
jgi:hypothetical protein